MKWQWFYNLGTQEQKVKQGKDLSACAVMESNRLGDNRKSVTHSTCGSQWTELCQIRLTLWSATSANGTNLVQGSGPEEVNIEQVLMDKKRKHSLVQRSLGPRSLAVQKKTRLQLGALNESDLFWNSCQQMASQRCLWLGWWKSPPALWSTSGVFN